MSALYKINKKPEKYKLELNFTINNLHSGIKSKKIVVN